MAATEGRMDRPGALTQGVVETAVDGEPTPQAVEAAAGGPVQAVPVDRGGVRRPGEFYLHTKSREWLEIHYVEERRRVANLRHNIRQLQRAYDRAVAMTAEAFARRNEAYQDRAELYGRIRALENGAPADSGIVEKGIKRWWLLK